MSSEQNLERHLARAEDRVEALEKELADVEQERDKYRELLEGIAWDIKNTVRR
jgi:hypothetical protein